jgi:hypothetical protein
VRDQANNNPAGTVREGVGCLLVVVAAGAAPVKVWTGKPGTAGVDFFGWDAAIGWLLIPLHGAFVHPNEPQVLILKFWGLTTLMLLVHKACLYASGGHKERRHSRQMPRPWLCDLGLSADAARNAAEPVLFLLAGGWVYHRFEHALGSYLIFAGVCAMILGAVQGQLHEAKVKRTVDAQIEAENLVREVRERYGR